MYLKVRQNEISRLIEVNGRVTVTDLSKRFGVTEDCIRKDLRQMSAEGRCRKVYGGAVRLEPQINRNVAARTAFMRPEKHAIAKKAISLLRPRQTIYLDISSTNILLARVIGESGVACTVVTNSVDAAREASRDGTTRVICPGGLYNAEYNGYVGSLAARGLERHRFDVAFMGAVGVDVSAGDVYTLDLDDAATKQVALERASMSVLLCDTHKLGRTGSYAYAKLDDFDRILCDDDDQTVVEALAHAGADVM